MTISHIDLKLKINPAKQKLDALAFLTIKDVSKEIDIARKNFKNTALFGFHTFGEIGAKMHNKSQVCNQSVSTLLVYNKILTE